jgi:DNA-binding IclR family transcriptional regulator
MSRGKRCYSLGNPPRRVHDMKRASPNAVPAQKVVERVSGVAEYRVQVLDRALSILDVLATENQLAPAAISARIGLHKSTVHRLLSVLERNEYLYRDPMSGRYSLGLRLIELGTRASARLDLSDLARPMLDRLMQETGETAHIGILDHGTVVSIADSESYKTLRTPSTVGRRTPAHCSSQGKMLLAEFSPSQLRAFVRANGLRRFTRLTICRIGGLERELLRVRANGYAIDDQEFEEGLKCIGAAIRDRSGNVVAAMSIAGPAVRLREERMPQLIQAVMNAAARLSSALSSQPAPNNQ